MASRDGVGAIDLALDVQSGAACILRLFYPSTDAAAEAGARRARWLPDVLAAFGYLDYAVNMCRPKASAVLNAALYCIAVGMALLDAAATRIAPRWRSSPAAVVLGAAPARRAGRMPCVVFSHGLAGMVRAGPPRPPGAACVGRRLTPGPFAAADVVVVNASSSPCARSATPTPASPRAWRRGATSSPPSSTGPARRRPRGR